VVAVVELEAAERNGGKEEAKRKEAKRQQSQSFGWLKAFSLNSARFFPTISTSRAHLE